jgi:hypothetical protein
MAATANCHASICCTYAIGSVNSNTNRGTHEIKVCIWVMDVMSRATCSRLQVRLSPGGTDATGFWNA